MKPNLTPLCAFLSVVIIVCAIVSRRNSLPPAGSRSTGAPRRFLDRTWALKPAEIVTRCIAGVDLSDWFHEAMAPLSAEIRVWILDHIHQRVSPQRPLNKHMEEAVWREKRRLKAERYENHDPPGGEG